MLRAYPGVGASRVGVARRALRFGVGHATRRCALRVARRPTQRRATRARRSQIFGCRRFLRTRPKKNN
jgi:hypothetical protein